MQTGGKQRTVSLIKSLFFLKQEAGYRKIPSPVQRRDRGE
jgi:hypothetical protein